LILNLTQSDQAMKQYILFVNAQMKKDGGKGFFVYLNEKNLFCMI
jgi:hypothetical protein